MISKDIDCDLLDSEGVLGEYANSFRVIRDGADILLDFCLYSETNKVAKLISRIRVNAEFLEIMYERLKQMKLLELKDIVFYEEH